MDKHSFQAGREAAVDYSNEPQFCFDQPTHFTIETVRFLAPPAD